MGATSIILIGGGVAGLATALELARRGHRVTVLEQGQPGQESSWAGAGILSLLLPWQYDPVLNHLAEHSLALYERWITGIRTLSPTNPEHRRTGMLVLPPYDIAAAAAWLSTHRQPDSRPPIADDFAHAALWLPQVEQVRNPRLLQALIDALACLGVEIHSQTRVTDFKTQGDQVTAVEAGGRVWRADQFVVTAGAWSKPLFGIGTQGLPIRPIRGQMRLYQASPGRLPCIVYEQGHYLVPRADGHILAGSTLEDVGYDKAITAAAGAALHAFTARLLPDVASRGALRQWAGLRPGSPANRPIVGAHPSLVNLYANAGHFCYGITLAPACAELVADLIEGRPPQLDPALFAWPSLL